MPKPLMFKCPSQRVLVPTAITDGFPSDKPVTLVNCAACGGNHEFLAGDGIPFQGDPSAPTMAHEGPMMQDEIDPATADKLLREMAEKLVVRDHANFTLRLHKIESVEELDGGNWDDVNITAAVLERLAESSPGAVFKLAKSLLDEDDESATLLSEAVSEFESSVEEPGSDRAATANQCIGRLETVGDALAKVSLDLHRRLEAAAEGETDEELPALYGDVALLDVVVTPGLADIRQTIERLREARPAAEVAAAVATVEAHRGILERLKAGAQDKEFLAAVNILVNVASVFVKGWS